MTIVSLIILCVAVIMCRAAIISRRAPDFIIGGVLNPQLNRWFVVPRNRFGNIYLHQIMRSDDDQALHDHPWWSISFIFCRGYWEITPAGRFWRGRGAIIFRTATAAHRLEIPTDKNAAPLSCWTLFITGPRIREWGFHCPQGWRPWQEFVDARDTGAVGRGCGE